jgi:hypothetical protein
LKDKLIDTNSKLFGHTYFAGDLDDNPHTEDNTGILDRYRRLVELDAVSVLNDMKSFERTVCVIFPDSMIYVAFKVTEEPKIKKDFMQLLYEERMKHKNNQPIWIIE